MKLRARAQRWALAAALLVAGLAWTAVGRVANGGSWDQSAEKETTSQLTNTFGTGADCVAFSRDGNTALTVQGVADRNIALWNLSTGKQIRTFSAPDTYVYDAAFSPDGARIFAWAHVFVEGPERDQLQVWDANSGVLLHVFPSSFFGVDIAVSSDGARVVVCGDKEVEILSTADGHVIRLIPLTTSWGGYWVPTAAFSPDGGHVLVGGIKAAVIFDVATGASVCSYNCQENGGVTPVALSPDGTKALCANENGSVAQLWDTSEAGTLIRTFRLGAADGFRIAKVAFSPDGSRVLTAASNIVLWDTSSGERLTTISPETLISAAVAFSPDGSKILAGGTAATYLYTVTTPDSEEETEDTDSAACACAKSLVTLAGLKSRIGDLFLTGLTFAALAALRGRHCT